MIPQSCCHQVNNTYVACTYYHVDYLKTVLLMKVILFILNYLYFLYSCKQSNKRCYSLVLCEGATHDLGKVTILQFPLGSVRSNIQPMMYLVHTVLYNTYVTCTHILKEIIDIKNCLCNYHYRGMYIIYI